MAFPPPKKKPFPKKPGEEDESASPELDEGESASEEPEAAGDPAATEESTSASDEPEPAEEPAPTDDDESTSDVPADKMKGAKENPLRRWANSKQEAASMGMGTRPALPKY